MNETINERRNEETEREESHDIPTNLRDLDKSLWDQKRIVVASARLLTYLAACPGLTARHERATSTITEDFRDSN